MWSFFRWSAMRNFSEGPALSIAPFQKVQREVMYFPYVVRKVKTRRKLFINCSTHDKNLEISCPYNFWTPRKAISLMFETETETVRPCLFRKLNWGGISFVPETARKYWESSVRLAKESVKKLGIGEANSSHEACSSRVYNEDIQGLELTSEKCIGTERVITVDKRVKSTQIQNQFVHNITHCTY